MRQGRWGNLVVGAMVLNPQTNETVEVIAIHPKDPSNLRLQRTDGTIFTLRRPLTSPTAYTLPPSMEAPLLVAEMLGGEILVEHVRNTHEVRAHLAAVHKVIAAPDLTYAQIHNLHNDLHDRRVWAFPHRHAMNPRRL